MSTTPLLPLCGRVRFSSAEFYVIHHCWDFSVREGKQASEIIAVKITPQIAETTKKLGEFASNHYQLPEEFPIYISMTETKVFKTVCCFFRGEPRRIKSYHGSVDFRNRLEAIVSWDREIAQIGEHYLSFFEHPENVVLKLFFKHVPKSVKANS